MGWVSVAHFKSRSFTLKTARPERRHTTLGRDFGQRIGLIHELGKLRGAEELAHASHSGLRVNEVVGHDCRNVDARHALLDRTLHTKQANAILIFQQFADRTHAAVAEIVDIVDFALAIFKVHQFLDDSDNVRSEEHTSELKSLMRISYAVFS